MESRRDPQKPLDGLWWSSFILNVASLLVGFYNLWAFPYLDARGWFTQMLLFCGGMVFRMAWMRAK